MIKAIILDIGGVLVETKLFWEELQKLNPRLSEQDIWEAKTKDNLVHRFHSGEINQTEFVLQILRNLSMQPDKEILELASAPEKKQAEMVSLVEQLSKRYRIAILTNSGPGARLAERRDSFKYFAEFTLSAADIGVPKPEKEAYSAVLDRLQLKPKEAVFIDNKLVNVAGARQIGMKGIVFRDDLEQLKRELMRMGVVV